MSVTSPSFSKQIDAVRWLQSQGYKIQRTKMSADVRLGKVPTNADGKFEAATLLAYAAANLEPLTKVENQAVLESTVSRQTADANLKHYQAERTKLKLAKELGSLMPKVEHEQDLAARALFFKNEVRNFIHLYGGEIVHLVGGQESRLRDLVEWWAEKTGIWMDTWSQEREFLVPDDDADDASEDPAAAPAQIPLSDEDGE